MLERGGWVTLIANFRINGGRPPTTRVPGLSRSVVSVILRLASGQSPRTRAPYKLSCHLPSSTVYMLHVYCLSCPLFMFVYYIQYLFRNFTSHNFLNYILFRYHLIFYFLFTVITFYVQLTTWFIVVSFSFVPFIFFILFRFMLLLWNIRNIKKLNYCNYVTPYILEIL